MIKRIYVLFFLVLGLSRCYGQADSLPFVWHNAFRMGVGVESLPYAEIGLSRIIFTDKGLSSGTACFYTAAQIGIKNDNIFYGGKAGFETAWMIGMWAIEAGYITNSHQSQFYLTPKVGLSLFGICNLLYGYNWRTNENNSMDIGRHQVSLTYNFSKKLRKEAGL